MLNSNGNREMKRQILLGVLILLFIASFATAGPITVDDDGPADFNNIQAAIDAAVDGNVIEVAEALIRRGQKSTIFSATTADLPKDASISLSSFLKSKIHFLLLLSSTLTLDSLLLK